LQNDSGFQGRSSNRLLRQCKLALARRIREINPIAPEIPDYPGYLASLSNNLLPGITPELYQDEYIAGAGDELNWSVRNGMRCPPKMQAVHSSSALVVNHFAPWKLDLGRLALCGSGRFTSLTFEATMPTGLGGTPPHLDFLAQSAADASVAVESKATEVLREHRAEFAPSYRTLKWPRGIAAYEAVMRRLLEDGSRFRFLNAAQLIKHALGLSVRYGESKVVLCYLFWEPMNRDSYREFDLHREEIRQFASLVEGCSVNFFSCTYSDLWREWASHDVVWLRQHAHNLMERYCVSV